MERNEDDEFMLPGFRFHPTDEELVGFYLKRKIQQKSLSIELIKQLDIYKFDPWDLPKMATTGEKEWYFYCPRDRKYRNSARPNRVTGAGFWKATGTDRPIYSSEGSNCIGLKKSLVFYKGRAAKGIKTDWMMHEFRLPSVSDSLPPHKKFLDKNIPANEAWAICRIFKKANSSTRKALSHSWISPVFDTCSTSTDMINLRAPNNIQFWSNNITMSNKITNTPLQFGFCNNIIPEQSSIVSTFSPLHLPSWKPVSSEQASEYAINDASSLLMDMSTSVFGSENVDFSQLREGFSAIFPEYIENLGQCEGAMLVKDQSVGQFEALKSFPVSLTDGLKSNLLWDFNSSPCISSELSTSYSTNKCYST